MERETKIIETPTKKNKVEIKCWLTGGEKRNLTNSFIEKASINENGMKDLEITGDLINKVQDKAFETIIVSVNGVKENIIESILNMRSEDYDFVVEEINKISQGKIDEDIKKK